jgi:hypothetical protein
MGAVGVLARQNGDRNHETPKKRKNEREERERKEERKNGKRLERTTIQTDLINRIFQADRNSVAVRVFVLSGFRDFLPASQTPLPKRPRFAPD